MENNSGDILSDLAKEKLSNLEVAYNEGDWNRLERLLDAKRNSGGILSLVKEPTALFQSWVKNLNVMHVYIGIGTLVVIILIIALTGYEKEEVIVKEPIKVEIEEIEEEAPIDYSLVVDSTEILDSIRVADSIAAVEEMEKLKRRRVTNEKSSEKKVSNRGDKSDVNDENSFTISEEVEEEEKKDSMDLPNIVRETDFVADTSEVAKPLPIIKEEVKQEEEVAPSDDKKSKRRKKRNAVDD